MRCLSARSTRRSMHVRRSRCRSGSPVSTTLDGCCRRNGRPRDAIGIDLAHAFIEPIGVAALGRLFTSATQLQWEYPDAPFDPNRITRLFEPALWNQLV